MHVVCVFLKYVILRALHRMNTKTIALTLVAVAIVAALLVFALSPGGDDDREDGSDSTVMDYAGRTVNIPENLDDGIGASATGICVSSEVITESGQIFVCPTS